MIIMGWYEMLGAIILIGQLMLLATIAFCVFVGIPFFIYTWIVKKRNARMERLFEERKINGFTYW